MTRPRRLGIFVGAGCMALLVAPTTTPAIAGPSTVEATTSTSTAATAGPLTVIVPAAQAVGTEVAIDTSGATPFQSLDVVALQGARRTMVRVVADQDGLAHAVLKAPFTNRAGLVTVTVLQRGRQGLATFFLRAGQAVDPGTLVVGARSIVANGTAHAMAVAIPHDALGNPMEDGTLVDLAMDRPDGSRQQESIAIGGELAWLRFYATVVSGRTAVAALTGMSNSPEADIREVAGNPVPFTLSVLGADIVADGRSTRIVRTSVLADKFGNVLPDGSSVIFTLDGPDGRGRAWGTTIRGVAEISVPASERSGTVTVVAWSHGTLSSSLKVPFATDVIAVPLSARRSGPWEIEITVGPVIGQLGGYLADGTPITVTFVGGSTRGRSWQGTLVDGVFSQAITADTDVHTVEVDILGESFTAAVSP